MSLQNAARLQAAGRLAEARGELKRRLAAAPGDAAADHLVGVIASQQGDLDGARKWMARSVELAPRNAAFRINLAAILGNLQRAREAIEQLKIGATLPGGNRPELHNNIGVAHERLGELREAADAYKCAIALDPNYADAYVHLGNACRKASRFDEAIQSYRKAVRLNPRSPKVLDSLAACHVELGNGGAAIECYRKAADLEPENPSRLSAMLYTLHYDPAMTPEALYEEHRKWDCPDPIRVPVRTDRFAA